MKTNEQILIDLKNASGKLGFDASTIQQGSDEWKNMKMGVITASNADCILAGKRTATRRTYINELIGQTCTGQRDEVSSKTMQWGKDHEKNAVNVLEFHLGKEGIDVPLVYKDQSLRSGCSPDRLFDTFGAEIKCPFATKTHIDFIRDETIKSEYVAQVQFSMWITERESWYFCSYDPRMKAKSFKSVLIQRDEEIMKKFDILVPEMVEEIDEILKKIGLKFGCQWNNT